MDYDLFVIGGGSGGVRAARVAASHGARVAIAEEYRFGGTCVIRGCVPKKLLVYASRFPDEFADAKGFGWTVGEARFDWPTLIANKDREIARLEGIYRGNLEKAGVAVFAERAVVTGPTSVRLTTSGRELSVGRILVATGGRPALAREAEGRDLAITSNEAFHLPELPRHIVIYGGGYIAVEFAGIFAGLGSRVTLVYRGSKVLRGFDEELRDQLTTALEARGIALCLGRLIMGVSAQGPLRHARLDDGRVLEADAVMFATGRVPNTAGLGLETAGVALGSLGEVIVDAQSRSSVPSIFAVGDVTNRVNLTPVAIREGHAFADSEFGGKPWTVEHRTIPTAVFSTPEIGTVGLGEEAARAACGAIDVYKTRFRTMKATLSGSEERMFMKLVVEAGSGRIVGCHCMGPDSAEIVQMAAIAMRMGATKADFDATMALHPSVAEELVTLREKWVPPQQQAAE